MSTVRLLVTLQFSDLKCVLFILPNNPCKGLLGKTLAVAISQSALLKIRHWEPWENLNLARSRNSKKFGNHRSNNKAFYQILMILSKVLIIETI